MPNAFAGLDVDPGRLTEVAALIPGAMRGITSENQLGTYTDLDLARRGLTSAIVAYLETSQGPSTRRRGPLDREAQADSPS